MNALKRDAERKNLQQQTVDPNATYGEKIRQTGQNVREQIKYDQDIYGEGLSDSQVRQINKVVSEYVSQGDTLEDMQSRSYRMAQAMMYSNKLGISIQDAMEQLDSMNLATLGEAYNQNDDVGNFNALKNSFMLGINQIIGAHFGNMMSIHAAMGNQSGYDDYLLKLESLQRENQALSDPFKRNIAMEALKYGAQSAPFSIGTQLLSFIPEIGPALSFGASMWNSYGSLYADFRQKGAGHAESLGVATVAAGLDAFIEVSLGELAVNGAGELGETVFKKLTGKSREELVNKLTTEVFKRVKYNGALDNLLKESTKFVGSSIEEGIEEVLQYWNDELADATVAALSKDYDLEKLGGAERTKKIVKESAENFKGGFLGALTMGIPMQTGAHILNKAVLTSSINEARDVLSTVDSKVEAEKRLFNNPLFKGETDAETLENIDRHFDQYQFMRDQNYTKQAEELAELTQPAEGFAEAELDENGDPIATDAYRNAGGMLHVQDDVRENENGVTEGTYKVGNPSKKTKNLDGYIDYTLDEKNHTVEINKFIMSDTREDIRAEFFDRFAKDFAGYEIKWDPEGQRAIDLKNSLIKANPNGKNNGLSYYTDETTVADMQTRKNIAKQIKAAMPNLSNSQIAADVALLETVYKSLKKDNGYTSFTDYYQKTFGENIFGDKSVLEKSSIEQNGGKGVRGGVAFNQTEKSLRAVIYASEKADFSTWSHEIAHIFRQQLQGDLLREAETAFGVENGQWTRQNEEAFAEGFEKFLHTGQAQNNKLKNLFTKLAEFMARVYGALKGYVKFNPEVENVYNQLLKEGDDSVLAQAEKAVRENDKLIREEERQYAEEQKKAQSEVKAQEDFEKSETNYVEQEQEETVEDKDLDQEIQDMSITAEDGSIDKNKFKDFVDRVKAQAEQAMLADVEKRKQTIMETLEGIDQNVAEEIADIMTDPNSTAEDKQRAATLAGGLKKLEQIDLFQTMNYETVRYIANERVKGEIAFSLKQALELKNKGYSESAIASQTSWRYNNGDWTYEFDDKGMQVNFSKIRDTLKKMKENELNYFNGYGKVTLAQVLQHDKLYELFPEMKDIKVEFTSSNSVVKSLYDPKRNAIILNLKNRDLRMSLAAACQRYIQSLTQDITPSLELTADLNAEYQKVMSKFAWEKINGLDYTVDAIGVTQATKDYLADRLNQEVLNTANRWRMDHATRSYNKPGRADDSNKMYFQATKEEIAEANEYVKTFDPAERERIESNLKKHAGTPWHISVVNALRARRDINSILETGIIPEGSIVNEVKNYREVLTDGATIEERTEHLWEYFECDSSLIGNPSKPLNAVASSFINCNPSSECAEYCYAVKGRSGLYSNILNRELINYLIEKDPARAAEDVADDYKATREYKNGVALRLLDTGDLSEPWLKFIEELNKRDISCQVFSKRPELLSKIDRNKNVVLLSIDKSNRDLAEQNPDLPIAFVYSGDEDRQFIIDNETRFTKYNGVILPVVMNHKRLTREEVAKLPKWSLNYTCPIDAGWKEIGSYKERKKDKGKWNCSVCDMNGQGCFFNRAVKDRQKFYATLKEMPNEYARSINEELKSESVRNKLKSFGLNESDLGSFLETITNIVNEKLANVDTEGTGSRPGRYSETLSQTEENEGSQRSETGSQETEPGKIDLYQSEIDDIREQYINTDQWLKAPNGSDTKLNEKQWLQVRTPSFKNWFGDWENDPTNASKVVDENGEPLVVYHGTKENFDTFTFDNLGSSSESINAGKGIFFVSNKEAAKYHGTYNDYQTEEVVKTKTFQNLIKKAHEYLNALIEKYGEENKAFIYKDKNTDKDIYVDFNEYKKLFEKTLNDKTTIWFKDSYSVYSGNTTIYDYISSIYGYYTDWKYDSPENKSLRRSVTKLNKLKVKKENIIESFLNIRNPSYSIKDNTREDNSGRDGIIARNLDYYPFRAINYSETPYKTDIFVVSESPNQIKSATDNNGQFDPNNPSLLFQEEKDPEILKWLNSTPTVKAYRSVQLQGKDLYPPMAGKVLKDGKLVWQDPIKMNTWERSEEYPEMVKDGMFPLHKGNNKTIWAIYAPYMHSADGMLNDQFKEAQDRPELVTVEVEIPLSELEGENPYTAEGSKRSVGRHDWPSGIVTNQLTTKRNVNLSRWDKVVRIVPNEEVVQNIDKMLIEGGYNKDIPLPTNTFTPQVKEGLEKLGYKFVKTDNKGMFAEGPRKGKSYSHVYGRQMLFQPAYHGSAANFDKFNTDEYGFSGEGSMSFGYGTYVSASEDIARDYAERQRPDYDSTLYYKGNPILYEDNDKYLSKLWNRLKSNNFDLEKVKEELKILINESKSDLFKIDYEKELTEISSNNFNINDFIEDNPKTNLYTVDIPDDGYIVWDKDVDPKLAKTVKDAVFNKLTTEPNEDGDFEYKGVEKELQRELKDVFDNEMTGEQLYNNVAVYVGGERNASKLLNKLGIPGIDYPAGTNFGTPDGKEARNYVIFNDDDAKIIDHLLFQTEQELYDDARMFDNWQDFMEFYEYGFGKPSPTLVPEDPDAAWYQTTWEMAHNIKPESQENEEIVQSMVNEDKNNEDPAEAKDALFITKLQRPGELENFLSRIYDLRNMSEDMWTDVESEEDANERDKYTELQDYVKTYLNHGSLISNMSAVAQGKDLKESERQKIINLMSNNARNYREAYSKIMEDESLAVDITKEPGYRLSDPENNFVRKSFEERKRISEQVRNEDLAKEIRDGSLQMNDKLDKYIEYCDKQIKAAESEKRKAEQKLKDLNMEVQGDYQRIADWETRRLLELHDQLLMAKTKLKNHSDEVARRLDRGIKLTGKYDKTSQNLKANYDEIYRKFEDLRKTIEISEQVKAALKEREKYVEFKDKAKENQDEKKLIEKAKKMRIQLVKRAMRRVPFQKINYDQARTLIAIQRTLEPNLLGGVNKWIGQDQAYLRGVISSWITDEVERKKLTEYLKTKGTKTAMYVLDKLQETKTIEDFNAWTKQDRSKAHRVLPKENWIRELNLEQLAEEREKSIQLDITTRDETRTVTGKDGKTQVLTLTRVEMSPELEQTIKEALGDKLFNQVMAVPFNEWTTEEMEELAKRIDDIYIEGRNLLAAKKQIRLEEAKAIRDAIESRLKDPGIYISEGDDDETKKRKYAKIEKILGRNDSFKGTTEGSKSLSLLDKIAYGDANVLRVGRILDNYDEAENVMELYRKEDQCYNDKARAINIRNKNIERVMKENNITVEELTDYYKLGNHKFTVDELLFFIAADADHEIDPTKKKQEINDPYNLAQNDDYAPTSRNAVMFGTMFSSSDDLDFKEECRKEDEEMQKRLENNELTADEKNLNTLGILVKKPGTLKYLKACKSRYAQVLNLAYSLDEKYLKLLEAINKDYADQYERMNKASIEYFNIPVNRVKAYVPLVRLESNGDTNENRVMEDLLGSQGIGKQWVDKGMTKSRVNIGPLNQKPVETGLYKTWNSSVERTEHFIAYSPYVQELNRVYKSRDAQYLRGYMENRYGKGMVKYIDNYINEVANPNQIAARNSLDNIVRSMRGKTAPAYLAWKASGIIKQAATSPWPYLQFVSPDKYIKACFDIIASKGKLYDEIKAISPYMNDRVMDPMIDLIEENIDKANNPISYGINKFGKMGMQGLEWIDWVCVSPGWLACYRDKYAELKKDNQFKYDQLVAELTEQNDNLDIISPERMTTEQIKQKADNMTMTESDIKDKAREYADDCTRKCQPSNRAVDLAPIFKAQGPGSEVGKALLQFQTSLNVIWQNIRYDLQYNAKQMGKSEIPMSVKKKMFSQICGITFAYVFAGIMMNAITDTPDEDDDKKDKVRKYMWYATTQFTDSVPVFGQALTSLSEQLITGKKSYESANDLFPMFTKFKNGIKFASGGNWSKAVSNFAEGLAMNFGLPTSGAKELLYAAGIGDKDGKLKFKPDAFIGRRRKEKK